MFTYPTDRFVRLTPPTERQEIPPVTPESLTATLRAHQARIGATEAAIMALVVTLHRAGLVDVVLADSVAEDLADRPLGDPLPGL